MTAPFTLVISDASTLTDWAWATAREDVEAAVRVLRGRKMTEPPGFYDEIAAALQFPYYFGENLAALDECLTDLEWLPANRYVLVIQDAAHVLSTPASEPAFAAWIELLANARRTWTTPVTDGEPWDRPARGFSIVMHATPDDAARLRQRLGAAKAPYDERAIA
ncbi:MAG TPA: barstar family protein [Gemmatimonadaceae bacterium]|jgi:RNAse (barnase) inhibitor barstar|nr:barstar family protein [Gemmatimonadaceae bacterium]